MRYLTVLLLMFPMVALSAISVPPLVSGRDPNSVQQILPADVLARAKLLHADLKLIQKAMGKSDKIEPTIRIQNASPREVYYEAQSLFNKANQLAYEVTNRLEAIPETPERNLSPRDVLRLVNQAYQRVLLVKNRLGIKNSPKEINEPISTTPSQVFNMILKSNQLLNTLLYKKFTPSDVYSEITLAINYVQAILTNFPSEDKKIIEPQFIPNKSPSNVYQNLLEIVGVLHQISVKLGIKMLNINYNESQLSIMQPGEVYDLAKIVVAEVVYFNSVIGSKAPHFEAYYAGYKTPSDVFQRTELLKEQLKIFLGVVSENTKYSRDGT